MGDRVSVEITVLAKQKEAFLALIPEDEHPDSTNTFSDVSYLSFYEVNYGDLDCLEDLRNSGIAFDYSWGSGGDYSAGRFQIRYSSEGVGIQTGGYDSDQMISLDGLRKIVLSEDPVENKLKQIEQCIADADAQWTPLPLDEEQIQNGKIFLVNKILE